MSETPQDPREAEIADAQAQRAFIDRMLAEIAAGAAATRPAAERVDRRNRQNGYGQNLELIYRPKGAVA